MVWAQAFALGGAGTLRDLRLTTWGAREGAPAAVSNGLAQTSDGYLWLGDHTGLYRFDAARFEHVELPGLSQLSASSVSTLYAPSTGGLWIGYTLGGVAFLKDGKATAYGRREGLPIGTVRSIAEQLDGTLWMATSQGLGRLEGGRWRRAGEESGLPSKASPRTLLADSVGALWMRTESEVYRLGPGKTRFDLIQRVKKTSWSITESTTGSVWISDGSAIQRIWKNPPSNHNRRAANSNLIVDDEGSLWYFADELPTKINELIRIVQPESLLADGGILIAGQTDRIDSINQRPIYGNGALLIDHEGNVWLTSERGIARFSMRTVRPVLLDGGRPSGGQFSALAAAEDGAIWLNSEGSHGGTFLVKGAEVKRVPFFGHVDLLTRLRSGQVVMATGDALLRWSGRRFEELLPPGEEMSSRVQAVAEDGQGTLWVSVIRKGIYGVKNGKWQLGGGMPSMPALAPIVLSDDRSGDLWAGYPDGRVARVSGDQLRLFDEADGLRIGPVLAVFAKRRHTWVGGDAGLVRLDGHRFITMSTDDRSALRNITGIVETESGDLWLNAARGIVHITAADIARSIAEPEHKLGTEIFDSRAGLEGSGARFSPLPTLIEGSDGILWAMTSVATYSIDPRRVFRSPLAPAIHLHSFVADDIAQATTGLIELPARTSTLRIGYEALSLTSAEQIRFRYRLEGVDQNWSASQEGRVATYMNLAPGTYRFRVQARIAGEAWPDAEASISFTIAPAFVQTRTFVVLCVAGLLMVIWFADRLRAKQLARRLRIALVARLEERERIAQELHDTLLQDTMGFTLTVHGAASRLAPDDPVRRMLERAAEQGEQGVREGRDRIAALRADSASDDDLAASLKEAGEQWFAHEDARFDVHTSGKARSLHPTAHDEAYRIAREAIANARRHANASAITVELDFGECRFTLRVIDDGRGLDEAVSEHGSRDGHWGLPGMRQRAMAVGGAVTIRSEPGAGTEVEFSLPAELAYWPPREPSKWSIGLARMRSILEISGSARCP
jgi:signal transduction histidine kinase/ligand-binding sensor domain-containing protein